MDNQTIARRLMRQAREIAATEDNFYRIRAYRRAAESVLRSHRPLAEVVAEFGRRGLEELPGIGSHLSYAIEGLVRTGEFHTLSSEERATVA